MAQIGAETDFRVGLESEVGAIGLMQIRSSCHQDLLRELQITDLYNPYENVLCGIEIMSRLFAKYNEPNLALMAYNSGENGARRKWNNGIYSTRYTTEVLTVTKMYEDRFGY